MQPFLIDTGAAMLEVAVAAELPAQRVMVIWHPRGWQVGVVRMDGEQVLPTVYADHYDAERAAAGIAVQCDITLVCDDDPDGCWAEMWIDRIIGEAETDAAQSRWML